MTKSHNDGPIAETLADIHAHPSTENGYQTLNSTTFDALEITRVLTAYLTCAHLLRTSALS